MITQLFKMMWHRKGKNFLLLIEIFFSFMVLFAILTMAFSQLRNYFIPTGFAYKDVYMVDIDQHGEKGISLREKLFQIKRHIQSMPEIGNHSLTGTNIPYAFSRSNNRWAYDGKEVLIDIFHVEPAYFDVLDVELLRGRFLQKGDDGEIPWVVINEKLADFLFKEENPVGKELPDPDGEVIARVAGVVKQFRQNGEYEKPTASMFYLINSHDTAAYIPTTLLIEAKAGAAAGWQQELLNTASSIAPDWAFEEESLVEVREAKAKFVLVPIIALGIIGGFLVFNVVLGLYGVLWYNISKRFSEIGIRRALGATQPVIRRQMVGEVLVLATFGLLFGLVLAVQFPLLGVFDVENEIYAAAIGGSLLLIYLLVTLCAWYPSRQAAAIEPATALHYE